MMLKKAGKQKAWGIVIALAAIGVLILYFLYSRSSEQATKTPRLQIVDALSAVSSANFARALKPRPFQFPVDHGPHEEYRTEWWYFTGNLTDHQQQAYGYELTFFRFALDSDVSHSDSNWWTNQVYMAHFALTDVANKKFHAHERFSRKAMGLAGAESTGFKVWLYDWQASSREGSNDFPLEIQAAQDNIAIKLNLEAMKPIVSQGDQGLSQKSAQPGDASYYYSATRLKTDGTLLIDGNTIPVNGLSWMDHEWSTSALSKDQSGWDWFSIQLDNGLEIMYYQLRKKQGGIDPNSAGTLILENGKTKRLSNTQVNLTVLDDWQSSLDNSRYPSHWQISIPNHNITLDIQPVLNNQELNVSFRYWEGAVQVKGSYQGEPVQGRGYVELTGYANSEIP
ncbi:MAG: lipocalin-like domain-containing protein [Methylococcales bacterium]